MVTSRLIKAPQPESHRRQGHGPRAVYGVNPSYPGTERAEGPIRELESSITADSDNRILEKCRHLQVLLEFLNLKFQRPLAQADKRLLKETPTVVFEDIWYLLKPGTLVYFLHDGLWLGGAIESVSRRSKDSDKKEAWIVNVLFQDVDFYKHALGRAPCCIIIEAFDGEKLVTSLAVLPCQFHDRQDNGARRAAFQKRGALVADIVWSGYKYMKYSGTTMDRKKKKVTDL
jgi:hypothetical protein